MKVTAIKPAFYNGHRIRVGAVVEVPENFKGSWFAKNDTAAAKAAKPVEVKETPKALSELGNAKAKSFVDVNKPLA